MAGCFLALLCIGYVVFSTTAQMQNDGICGSNTPTGLEEAHDNAASWILSQREASWGWSYNTAQAVLSLQLANNNWYNENNNDIYADITVKQLEIELLADLAQTTPTFSPGILAYYIMALNATCHDVTDFYGFDLVDMLQQYMDDFPDPDDFNNYFQYGLAVLALCQTSDSINDSYVQQIIDGQDGNGNYQYGSDVASMALMAMACIEDKVQTRNLRKQLQHAMKRTESFLKLEQSNGTWEINEISTALASQALLASGVNPNQWDCADALQSVVDGQDNDGHFISLGGTLQIMPLLASKTFADVKNIVPNCSVSVTDETNQSVGQEITVILRVENGVDNTQDNATYVVNVTEGVSVYEAMVAAVSQHTTFSFNSPDSSFGHYIQEMNGLASDGANSLYWTILIGAERVSATVGIDGLETTDGETYIFFYKSFA